MVSMKSGISGGGVATIVAGSIMLMNHALHRLPDLEIGPTLAAIVGLGDHVVVAWLLFIALGVFVCGTVFAFLAPLIPLKSYLIKGLVCGVACWLLVMLVFMPLAGAGPFGLNRGHIVAASALVLSLVYWVALGFVYRWSITADGAAQRVRV